LETPKLRQVELEDQVVFVAAGQRHTIIQPKSDFKKKSGYLVVIVGNGQQFNTSRYSSISSDPNTNNDRKIFDEYNRVH